MKKHPVRIIKDFRQLVYGSAEKYGKLPAFKLRDKVITYNEFMEDYRSLCRTRYGERLSAVLLNNADGRAV